MGCPGFLSPLEDACSAWSAAVASVDVEAATEARRDGVILVAKWSLYLKRGATVSHPREDATSQSMGEKEGADHIGPRRICEGTLPCGGLGSEVPC